MQGWYINGERVSAAEVRRVLRGAAARSWAPSEELERFCGELAMDAATDVGEVCIERVFGDETHDERVEVAAQVTTIDVGYELEPMQLATDGAEVPHVSEPGAVAAIEDRAPADPVQLAMGADVDRGDGQLALG